MRPWDLALLEGLRFVRRRETFWLVAVLAVSLLTLLWLTRTTGVQPAPTLRFARLCAAATVAIFTSYRGMATIRSELEGDSFGLLLQVPGSPSRLLLGKGAGVAIQALAVHSYIYVGLIPLRPGSWESTTTTLTWFVAVWVFAVLLIPEAMLSALLLHQSRRDYWINRVSGVVRWLLVPVLLEHAIRPELRQAGVHLGDVALLWERSMSGVDVRDPAAMFLHPLLPCALLLGWQLLAAGAIWPLLVRRTRRTRATIR